MKYEVLIGLEFHVQMKTKSKMFCSCANEADHTKPNTNICPICLGHPGTLPTVNKKAIKMSQLASLALGCKLNSYIKFDRKNYFYPDLPKGYQISQFDKPVAEHGELIINAVATDGLTGSLELENELKRIGITRLHIEEDSAKSIHTKDKEASLIDYNRGGAPLIEIVTDPDFSTPLEAKTFAQEIQLLMRHLDISDADMEKGHLRCDANISLRPKGETILYPKTEIKNINSFRSLEKALEFEIKRQKILWEDGKAPKVQETRGYDDHSGETKSQRTKEGFADYRYFPEPDIPPLTFSAKEFSALGTELPELPQAKRLRFCHEYTHTGEEAKIITGNIHLANYFEQIISELQAWISTSELDWDKEKNTLIKLATNWLINNLITRLDEKNISFDDNKISAENFAEFITLLHQKKLGSTNAVKVLDIMIDNGADPSNVLRDYGLEQVDNDDEIKKIIDTVITTFPDQIAEYQAGKETIIKFLLGQVMRESQGKADPEKAENLLIEKLKK
ncbi:Asp-tRNA(Asn)/Glu-tRNA(Gln) amidotransferase subunit GatB [Candidatus Falkowbacteria bacterium CG10_big_fil_rev_8_21_14_0_10_39_11]|uniref:Aspartyl/glutamyl-tRNA(Asn/Gln) amidotransferase subunit B n=1 Tax=Candidatus Falkowbacteria bacterium CG10_big_fil_rev_8_21_14_0_10_39_11 TaxID=1974565 RepID=A0A2H0V500_9BACT|nr:MAG: Asp-tRNA(Asn)/Glu-tRNA(Gln) amidotransferase subunit GatB [Candidatus Falkowbacteria bacterium CG10_big_fil_rev_8_21_14_0_10_39_11]